MCVIHYVWPSRGAIIKNNEYWFAFEMVMGKQLLRINNRPTVRDFLLVIQPLR